MNGKRCTTLQVLTISFGLAGAAACATAQDNQVDCRTYLELKPVLEQLRVRYTDDHPDVIRAQEMLDELEQSLIAANPGKPIDEICVAATPTETKPSPREPTQETTGTSWLLLIEFDIDGEQSSLLVSEYASHKQCEQIGQTLVDKFEQAGQQASFTCPSDQQVSEWLEALIN